MFKKEKIDFIYRLVCLIAFGFVILFSNNILTLVILGFFFFFNTNNDNNFLYNIFSFLTFVFLAFDYLGNSNYILSKLVIIVSYLYYFLIIPSFSSKVKRNVDNYLNKKFHIDEQIDETKDDDVVDDYDYIRFSKNRKKKVIKKSDLPTTIYVTYHLVILFLTIVLGGFI